MRKIAKVQRDIRVDDVKIIACFLVLPGHFFQSMTKLGVIPADLLYHWFEEMRNGKRNQRRDEQDVIGTIKIL